LISISFLFCFLSFLFRCSGSFEDNFLPVWLALSLTLRRNEEFCLKTSRVDLAPRFCWQQSASSFLPLRYAVCGNLLESGRFHHHLRSLGIGIFPMNDLSALRFTPQDEDVYFFLPPSLVNFLAMFSPPSLKKQSLPLSCSTVVVASHFFRKVRPPCSTLCETKPGFFGIFPFIDLFIVQLSLFPSGTEKRFSFFPGPFGHRP